MSTLRVNNIQDLSGNPVLGLSGGNLTLSGNLTVQGTTTSLETAELVVEDKNIVIGNVTGGTATDALADGGGITLKGTTDKTFAWIDATDAWTSSERISIPLGSAGAPSLTFTGDPNTGIYSPGADQVAIGTGGVGRLFVDASGNVGIASSSVQSLGVNYSTLEIKGKSGGFGGGIILSPSDSGTVPAVWYYDGLCNFGSLNSTPVSFLTNGTEKLRITSAGLVGIGTSSPSYVLDVAGSARVKTGATGTPFIVSTGSDSQGSIRFGSTGGPGVYGIYGGADYTGLQLWTGGVQALTIDNSQRVGIGTTSPINKLDIAGTTANLGLDGTSNTYINFLKSAANIGYVGDANWTFGGSSSDFGVRATSNLVFGIGANERARIDSSGRLLVGTSSARKIGDVFGPYNPSIAIEGSGSSVAQVFTAIANRNDQVGPSIALGKSRGSSNGGVTVVQNGDELGRIIFAGADGNDLETPGAEIGAFVDGTPGTNDMPGRLVFSTTADGASSPTERLRIDSAGQIEAGSLGSAAAPVWSFLSDPNTGIYSPGADQLALSTGGTGRLFVDASGNVGVGATPVVPLDVQAAQATQRLYSTTGANTSHIQFRNTGGIAYVGLDNSTGSAFGAAYGLSLTHTGAYPITFVTDGSERLRITSAGLVGIGTSAPGAILHLASNNPIFLLQELDQAANSQRWGIQSEVSILKFRAFNDAMSSAVDALSLTRSGSVGIGTTSPGAKLVVSDTASLVAAFGRTGSAGSQIALSDSISSVGIGCSSGALTFGANGYETERARIDSSGRLLVGTSSSINVEPFESAQVFTEARRGYVSLYRANDANGPTAYFIKSRGSAAPTIVQSGDVLGQIRFQGADGNNYEAVGASIRAEVDGTPGANDMPGRLVFSTTADGASSPTERMRITSNGAVRINTTNQLLGALGETFAVFGTSTLKSSSVPLYVWHSATGTLIDFEAGAGATVGTITTNGTTTSYNTSSDYRLKENIAPVTDGITRLQQLKPSRFNFIADPDKTVDGFIAHEVQTVVPEAITGEKDAVDDDGNPIYQGIDQSKLVPLLTAALQEAVARIETLEAKVAALEGA